jgi:SAM-dependent methyltransferase
VPEQFSSLSFRDPDGRVHIVDNRVFRFLRESIASPVVGFVTSAAAQKLVASHQLISSARRSIEEIPASISEPGQWLEHERIWFSSFPFEWAPEMLHAAGVLTLTVAEAALLEGVELKDATPFNVLFSGSQPVFIDVASIQRMNSRQLTWHAYAQFVQSFVLPLLAHRITGMRMEWIFSVKRDGLAPSDLQHLPGLWRFRAGRRYVLLPRLFTSEKAEKPPGAVKKEHDAEVSAYVRRRLYSGLRRDLRSLFPRGPSRSDVTEYRAARAQEEAEQTAAKLGQVKDWLKVLKPRRVLDIGANTGDYSLVAARLGASVVAIDKVPEAISLLYRRCRSESADIQPLVVDLMRPTPPVGWMNAEHKSFVERARGQFDTILFLAVIHHVVINDRVPLRYLLELLADLTASNLLIEFVAREDPNFVRVARGRDQLFLDYTKEAFESEAARFFRIESQLELTGGTRTLYLMRKERDS